MASNPIRLFAIGDVHLPSTRGKRMDRFGWVDHPVPLQRAWDQSVAPEDVVIVAGDISWATRPKEAAIDLQWLEARAGRKVLLKGNHDYWWGDSSSKLRKFFADYPSIAGFLHNSAVSIGPWVISGSRLWTAPEAPPLPGGELGSEQVRQEYVARECRRLELSFEDARQQERASDRKLARIVAVHFPPIYSNGEPTAFSKLIEQFAPKICVYGHLHGPAISAGFTGDRAGVRYVLASCDAAGFSPVLLDSGD
jgi:predicted phosphohydrolase